VRAYVLLLILLTVLWLIFSGKFDALHLGYGVLSIVLVMILCRGLVASRSDPEANEVFFRIRWPRAAFYPVWLLWQIVVANLQVAWLIVHPRMPIDPILLRFHSGLRSDLAKVTLGNSITLTPGTFTLRIEDDCFLIHSIHERLAAGLLDGSMQRQVAAVFGEEELPVEQMRMEVVRDVAGWVEEHY
jgi:multicomponent Na+:H+ antiporter subunit E